MVTANSANAAPHPGRRRLPLIAAAVLVGALAGLAAVYGIGGLVRNAGDPNCRPAVQTASRLTTFARGEVAAMALDERPLRVPDLAFHDADGSERKLSDWHGRSLLVNLWATWCIPCRREMPRSGRAGDASSAARNSTWSRSISIPAT